MRNLGEQDNYKRKWGQDSQFSLTCPHDLVGKIVLSQN